MPPGDAASSIIPMPRSGGRSSSTTRPKQTAGSRTSWQTRAMATAFGCRPIRRKSATVRASPSPNMMMAERDRQADRGEGGVHGADCSDLQPARGAASTTRHWCRMRLELRRLDRAQVPETCGLPVPATSRTRAPSSLSAVEAEVLAQLGDVAGGLDVVLRQLDLAVLVDDERRADHALDDLAVELLLAEGAVRRHHRPVRVGEQRDRQARRARGTSPASPACRARCRAPRSRRPAASRASR